MTGQTKGSEMASMATTRQTEGAKVDAAASEGAAEVCVAQRHKMAVAITGSTDDSGSTSGTTGLGITGLRSTETTGPGTTRLGTTRLGSAESTGTTRFGTNGFRITELKTTGT